MPDPTILFSASALATVIEVVAAIPSGRLEELTDEVLGAVTVEADGVPIDPAVEAEFEGQIPDGGIFDTEVSDQAALRTAIEAIDWRWRLDVMLAVEDIADAG